MANAKLLPIGTLPPGVKQAELAELKKVILQSFSVTPNSVSTFGSVTVSWSAVIPANHKFPINITVNGTPVPATGTQQWTLIDTIIFRLAAAITSDPSTSVQLAQHEVEVSDLGCTAMVVLDPPSFLTSLKQLSNLAFAGSSEYSLKAPGISLSSSPGQFSISVPISINVPDWFDGDAELSIAVKVSGLETLSLSATSSANVSWSLLSNVLSLGFTAAIGAVLTRLVTTFLQGILNNRIVPQMQNAFNGAMNTATSEMQANDSQHRVFGTTAISYSTTGLSITACPKG